MNVGISRDLITINPWNPRNAPLLEYSIICLSFCIWHMLHYAAFHPVARESQFVHTIRGFDWGDASNQKKSVHTTSHSKPHLKTLHVLFPIDGWHWGSYSWLWSSRHVQKLSNLSDPLRYLRWTPTCLTHPSFLPQSSLLLRTPRKQVNLETHTHTHTHTYTHTHIYIHHFRSSFP